VEKYGTLPDGREVKIFTLTNRNNIKVRVTEFGAILVSTEVPDIHGNLADLNHGYDTLEGWLHDTAYFGATVGRFGNRIANGSFSLDEKTYTLAKNNAPANIPCHLHGGNRGFNKVLWTGTQTGNRVDFHYLSPDGEEGYPGNLSVKVSYTLTDDNELIWQANATTDATTIVNIVQHSYWNLSGDPTTLIYDHELQLFADQILPTTPGMIPTGAIAPVADTAMDFTQPRAIGDRIDAADPNIILGQGYDHCWVLRPASDATSAVRLAARVKDPKSGRVMAISTDQPGVHFYSGNFLDGSSLGKNSVAYARRSGLCLETENFPDSPNHSHFPSSTLRPGETYSHTLIHTFSAE
jgi:aldose 1-epimerase